MDRKSRSELSPSNQISCALIVAVLVVLSLITHKFYCNDLPIQASELVGTTWRWERSGISGKFIFQLDLRRDKNYTCTVVSTAAPRKIVRSESGQFFLDGSTLTLVPKHTSYDKDLGDELLLFREVGRLDIVEGKLVHSGQVAKLVQRASEGAN